MSQDLELPPLSGSLRAMLDAERESHRVSSDRRSQLRLGVARKLATAAATATTLLVAEEAKGQLSAAVDALRAGHDELAKQSIASAGQVARHAASTGVVTAATGAGKAALVSKVGVVVTGLAFAGGVSVGTQVPRAPITPIASAPAAVAARPQIQVEASRVVVVDTDASVDTGVETSPLRVTREQPRAEPTSRDGTLILEQALIERAQRAIASADYGSALTALEEHRTRFPRGELVEERSAFLAIAYLRSGQREAGERAANAFLDRYPNAALSRVITRDLER